MRVLGVAVITSRGHMSFQPHIIVQLQNRRRRRTRLLLIHGGKLFLFNTVFLLILYKFWELCRLISPNIPRVDSSLTLFFFRGPFPRICRRVSFVLHKLGWLHNQTCSLSGKNILNNFLTPPPSVPPQHSTMLRPWRES